MKNRKVINFVALLFLSAGILTIESPAQTEIPPASARKALPNLALKTIDGRQWNLNENRGRVVLLNFWATWCEPCRTETPMLVKFADEYRERGLRVVGIALDEDGTSIIRKFVAEYKIDYPILLPVPGSALAQIDPVPTTILIDAEGRLVKKYVGAVEEEILRRDIEGLTGEIPVKSKTGGQ